MAAAPRPLPPNFTDHAFQSRSGGDLALRVWPADPPPSSPAPFIIWTHGGSFIAGHHFLPLPWLAPGFRQRGYHLVSHSYRLGPQARLDEQVEDSLEAVAWCRANLLTVLGQDLVDVDRYVLCGESSGGTIAALMVHRLDPPPKALIDVYGIIDFLSTDKIDGGPGGAQDLPPWKGEFSEEELVAFLSDRDPANILTNALYWNEQELVPEEFLSKYLKTDFKYNKRIRLQAELQVWKGTRKPAKGLVKTTFHAEKFADDQALTSFIQSQSALQLLEGKAHHPPTAFLHGTADVNVPLEQSQALAKRLREMGIPVVECYEPDQKHVFDDKYRASEARHLKQLASALPAYTA